MERRPLTYALVTPAHNESDNLPRLAACVVAQTTAPAEWVIVENGSTDDTLAVAEALAAEHAWIRVITIPERPERVRGGAIVRALIAGIQALESEFDLVVNLDADVSIEPGYFERLVRRIREGSRARHRKRQWFRARKRGLASAVHDAWHRLGCDACISSELPSGRVAARGAPRVGRARRAPGHGQRLEDSDPPRSSVPSPPPRRSPGMGSAGSSGAPKAGWRTTWTTGSGI